MRMRFKSLLFIIFVAIIITSSVGVGYLFYHKITDDSDIVVDGEITINYLSGKTFKLSGNQKIAFSVTNNDNKQKYYYIQLKDVYAEDVSYELSSSDNLEISDNLKSDIISNQVSINGNETVNYTITFKANDKETYSGTIQVGLKNNENDTFIDVLLANNKVGDAGITLNGEVATLDEGLLKKDDDLGVAYYFRGNTLNNNFSFAGLNWKIVKINGDGSVKVVLDGLIEEIGKYYDTNYSFSNSLIKQRLDNWYNSYLSLYADYIAYYKYCNDYILDSDGINTVGYNRIIKDKIPNYVCLGDLVNSKVGLLTVDEVMLAGGSNQDNKSYYLYNENIKLSYYTMSGASIKDDIYYPFMVTSSGAIDYNVSGNLLRGVRPVINIIRNVKVNGTGTSSDPYKIIS